MIILRQKQYARQDYAGLNMWQRIAKRKDRNKIAYQLKKGRSAANSALSSNIASANRTANDQLSMLENSDFAKSRDEKALATKDILNKNQQDVNNAFAQRNQEYSRLLRKAGRKDNRAAQKYTKDVTPDYGVSKVTDTYKAAPQPQVTKTGSGKSATINTQPQQQRQGIGLGGKLAIGAGVAAAGYGAYRLLKARKERKEAEEEQENKQRRQA